jgi:Rad3-related DNA helicase
MSLKEDLGKFTPRKEQIEALEFIKQEYKNNSKIKNFLLDLPPGVGKSHLALMISDWYTKNVNFNGKVDILTNSKILQDQYGNTYDSINDLKGKDNYECSQYSCSCAQGKEFNRLNKTSCETCPYDNSKDLFIGGKISLTNFYLYILYALYQPTVLERRGSGLLIVDEAHDFDDVFSDFISVKITESVIKRLNFTNEYSIIKKLSKVTNITSYVEFLTFLLVEIENTVVSIETQMGSSKRDIKVDKRDLKLNKLMNSKNIDVKSMQIITDLLQNATKIDIFLKEYKENPENWVLETGYNEKAKQRELSLEPIWAFDYLEKYVWSKYDMVVFMSGTILDKRIFCELNGLDDETSAYHSIDSPFAIKNRPIFYMPVGKMTFKNKEDAFKLYVPYIKKILKKYNTKGIIHTNSFELSNWIKDSVKDDRLLFHDSSNKDEVLKHHFESTDPTILVSPSMSTGISLDHEKSRFQVIAKVPYPSLASQKNKLRQKNNPEWYQWKTVSGIIQMTGRSVRSINDYADTIIIDGCFGDVIKYSHKYIPNYIQEAIKKVNINTVKSA